jgi:hypothetical protein
LERWARLIAAAQDAFPADLAQPDRDRLAAAVRQLLRERLVRHLAAAIALDLHGQAKAVGEQPVC